MSRRVAAKKEHAGKIRAAMRPKSMPSSRSVLPKGLVDFFEDPSPTLLCQICPGTRERPRRMRVEHRRASSPDARSIAVLKGLRRFKALGLLCAFHEAMDGFALCGFRPPGEKALAPMLEIYPASDFEARTALFLPGGDEAWIIDGQKSERLYRSKDRWLVIGSAGFGALTTFLEGEHAGCVFLLVVQPWFNTLRPIARGFDHLIERITTDITGFLRLVRGYAVIRATDGDNYFFSSVEYLRDARARSINEGWYYKTNRNPRPGMHWPRFPRS